MIRWRERVLRVIVFFVGMTGLLATLTGTAQAYIGHQHCEPSRRS